MSQPRSGSAALGAEESAVASTLGTVLYHRDLRRHSMWWANGLQDLLGCSAPDAAAAGEWWASRIHPKDRKGYHVALARALESGAPLGLEYRVRSAEGGWVEVRDEAVLVRERSGEPALMLGAIHDLSRLKNWQKASEVMDEFLARAFHDIRTPISSILIWLRVFQSSEDAEKKARALGAIENSATTLAELVDELFDLSLMITGKLRLQLQPVQLAPLIDTALGVAARLASPKGIRLEKKLDPRAGLVNGDPGRIEQLVRGLVASAISLSPERGTVEVVQDHDPPHARLTVRYEAPASGGGDEADLFEWRIASKRRGGVNLASAYHLALLHGGSISAQIDDATRKSRFIVLIPLLAEEAQPAPPEGPRKNDSPRKETPSSPPEFSNR
ncbi:MAG TPA: PAS domain-containing sensor histidine kinase [Candidatus Polarisedimenticolia bacterium]|nr:PAS domain-containing sensor histidine kinase [Candidatus Polarisedimenticolia bacterium]